MNKMYMYIIYVYVVRIYNMIYRVNIYVHSIISLWNGLLYYARVGEGGGEVFGKQYKNAQKNFNNTSTRV